MLRSSLIYLSKASWARQIVTQWSFAWKAASRFVAGEKLEEAIQAIRVLNDKGINATLDHLGEHTHNSEAAERATNDILQMVDGIVNHAIKANISIKLTQIGVAIDESLCTRNLEQILSKAAENNIFVRIDMEDSPWVDTTIKLYCLMQERGYFNTGLVIQAYLFRSEKDVIELAKTGTRIRLCKGAYKEAPEIAFPQKRDVDKNYDHLAEIIIKSAIANGSPTVLDDGLMPPIPAIASHDPKRIEFAKSCAEKSGLPQQAIEFQMLYGIRRDIQESLVKEGYPVRVYVPFGTEWYPYYVRRLAERPANVWFFVSNFFRH
jgi:proline dehydrogenase